MLLSYDAKLLCLVFNQYSRVYLCRNAYCTLMIWSFSLSEQTYLQHISTFTRTAIDYNDFTHNQFLSVFLKNKTANTEQHNNK